MRRLRTHDPPGYLLALAALALVAAGVIMGYEGTRFGDNADPWHHFWFDFAVFGFGGAAAALVIGSIVLFVREARRPANEEHEATGRGTTVAKPQLAEEVETKRLFRTELKRRFR